MLRKAEVYNYFDIMVCGDEVKNSKPSPDHSGNQRSNIAIFIVIVKKQLSIKKVLFFYYKKDSVVQIRYS